jgi:hypothetical protein
VNNELETDVALLMRTPRTLQAMLDGLPSALVDANEGAGTWSPRQVVGHLVHAERTNWIPRARVIMTQSPNGKFPAFDRFGHLAHADAKTLAEHLRDFAQLRAESLATLTEWNVSKDDLLRIGQHPEFGAVTLRQLIATWVTHDFTHLAQIVRVMAKRYREAVGPWRAYLSVLK